VPILKIVKYAYHVELKQTRGNTYDRPTWKASVIEKKYLNKTLRFSLPKIK
jgi:hypothetical protein